jgi:hypothetical protein
MMDLYKNFLMTPDVEFFYKGLPIILLRLARAIPQVGSSEFGKLPDPLNIWTFYRIFQGR